MTKKESVLLKSQMVLLEDKIKDYQTRKVSTKFLEETPGKIEEKLGKFN